MVLTHFVTDTDALLDRQMLLVGAHFPGLGGGYRFVPPERSFGYQVTGYIYCIGSRCLNGSSPSNA